MFDMKNFRDQYKSFNTPILFLIFNRPRTEIKVFNVIRKIRPKVLYVAADGPREKKPDDFEKCMEARKIIDRGVDWKCSVYKLYRDKNLGCKVAVSSAIDWFFDNVEEGIILEDDCLPDISFFKYCNVLLDKYRNNLRIMHISGNNFQNGTYRGESSSSYYFSKYTHVWGWATWRRAWKHYKLDLDKWSKNDVLMLERVSLSLIDKVYWYLIFKLVTNNGINTWDYQWVYAIWKNEGLSIIPNVNLVKNIGFEREATHTRRAKNILKNVKINEIRFPLKHPEIKINKYRDIEHTKSAFTINIVTVLYLFIFNIINTFRK